MSWFLAGRRSGACHADWDDGERLGAGGDIPCGVIAARLLGDVGAWTGFSDSVAHLRTGNPAADKPTLVAAALADGTNLGLPRIADASHVISFHHLVDGA